MSNSKRKAKIVTANLLQKWPRLTPENKRQILQKINLPDFNQFIEKTLGFKLHEWQTEHVLPVLESLVFEKGKRICMHAPPQFGKSILVSRRFPAWALGRDPDLRIVLAGFNATHSAEFAEVNRDIMLSREYEAMFPLGLSRIPRNANREGFSTAARASIKDGQQSITAVGLLSGFTGRGADILIIDDPYASPDVARSEAINERVWRWWNELAKVRINDDTNVIVMFHRYHEDDFAGRLLAEGGWQYLRFPAIADGNEEGDDPTGREPGEILSPIRSREFLQEIENRDPMVWLGMFQGRPRPPEGAFIRREYLKDISLANLPPVDLWVRFWDLATKADQRGDFYAGALVGVGPGQILYVRDMTRFREEWPSAREIIVATTESDLALAGSLGAAYDVGVEQVSWMRTMVQDLLTMPVFRQVRLTPVTPRGDKKERASGWVARAKVDLFRMVKGHWNQDFIAECLAFDGLGSTHDDQVDAVSGAYDLIWDLQGGLVEPKKKVQVGSIKWWKEYARELRGDPEYGDYDDGGWFGRENPTPIPDADGFYEDGSRWVD